MASNSNTLQSLELYKTDESQVKFMADAPKGAQGMKYVDLCAAISMSTRYWARIAEAIKDLDIDVIQDYHNIKLNDDSTKAIITMGLVFRGGPTMEEIDWKRAMFIARMTRWELIET